MKSLLCLLLFCLSAQAAPPDNSHAGVARANPLPPAYKWGEKFAFQFENGEKPPKPPYLRIFPGGKDSLGADVSDTLGTLKWARGKSKLYPTEDAAPGLIAVMRGLAFIPDKSGNGYSAIFEGEFNAVRIAVDKAQMESLLAGRPTELTFFSKVQKGIGVQFRVESTTKLQVRLEGTQLFVDRATGNCKVTKISFTGKESPHPSDQVVLEKEKGKPTLYTGVPGELKGLSIL